MIKYEDFSPQITERGLLGNPKKAQTLQGTIDTVNQWIADNAIEIINIETVMIPFSIYGKSPTSYHRRKYQIIEGRADWHQIIRVWHKV